MRSTWVFTILDINKESMYEYKIGTLVGHMSSKGTSIMATASTSSSPRVATWRDAARKTIAYQLEMTSHSPDSLAFNMTFFKFYVFNTISQEIEKLTIIFSIQTYIWHMHTYICPVEVFRGGMLETSAFVIIHKNVFFKAFLSLKSKAKL